MANSVVRLSIDSHEFDANIKRAGEALNKFFDQAKKGDRTFEVLDDDAMEVVKTFGKMGTSSKSARGQISELTKGFTDLSLIYKRLTDEEKASPVGKEMARSLGELKTRIQDTKKDLADIGQELSGSKFGQFGGIIDGIGHKMGMSANITELLTSKTALMTAGIGAAVAAIYKGTEAWTKYNAELSKQDQVTQVTTGLKGSSADHMTDEMRAVSDTYKVDFREAINAANTLMTQFGKSGDEAIQLIKDGMQGMIQGDGGKLLNMIQQFAPAFRDAGISADKLVAIIHNSEGGLFSDQNMNAILMGIKNIRLMTKATSDSLAKLGIDGQEMSRKMADGSMTVFEALKQVATKLKDCEAGSQEAGQVMQNVFGRQGAMQGMKLARAIAELNTNLEETKKQTGELGDAFAELQTANEKLNTAIRDAFSYDGWEQMAIGIKSTLISTLADVIDKLGDIRGLLSGLTPGQAKQNKYGTTGTPDEVESDLKALQEANKGNRDEMFRQMLAKYERRYQEAARKMESELKTFDAGNRGNLVQRYNPLALVGQWWQYTNVNTARSNVQVEKDVLSAFRSLAQEIISTPQKTSPSKTEPNNPVSTTPTASKSQTETQQNEAAIAKLTEEYQNLATAAKTADDAQNAGLTERMTAIQGEIRTLQERNAELKKFADEAKGVKVEVAAQGSLPQLTKQLKDLQQAQSQSLDTREWMEYQRQIDVTTTKIDILKGKWKEGQVATFSFEEKHPDKMVFTADNKDVLTKLAEIREAVGGIEIDEKTLTVTANTAEAVDALRKIDGVTIADKTLTITATDEALSKLRKIEGVTIADKTLTITATDEALSKLRKIEGVTIADKTLTITATDEALSKLREIDGVTIADKTLTITATDEALPKLREIEGVTIADKTLTITATDEALPKLREIEGVTIADKTLTVTANTAEAYNKVQELISGIEGTTVSFEVKPQTKPLPTLDDYRIQAMLEIDAQNTKVDTSTLQTLLADAMNNGIDVSNIGMESIAEQIGKGIDVSEDKWKEIFDQYNELRESIGEDPIQINFETGKISQDGKNAAKTWKDAASAVQSVGQAFNQIEDPAAKVAGTLAQAIASVALGYAQATKMAAETSGPWGWIAFAAAGLAQMVATISTIKSVAHYAQGGIVGGNDHTDNTLISVSSGELILNRSQQENLASSLNNGGGAVALSQLPYVTGEKIVLGVNNWAKQTGRGQLVFSKS